MSPMNAEVAASILEVRVSGSRKSKSLAKSHSTIESMPDAGATTRYAVHPLSLELSHFSLYRTKLGSDPQP